MLPSIYGSSLKQHLLKIHVASHSRISSTFIWGGELPPRRAVGSQCFSPPHLTPTFRCFLCGQKNIELVPGGAFEDEAHPPHPSPDWLTFSPPLGMETSSFSNVPPRLKFWPAPMSDNHYHRITMAIDVCQTLLKTQGE